MSLSDLPQIQTLSDPFYSTDASNPASALYVPPTGYYQNDAGQLVPNSTPNYGATGATGATTYSGTATGVTGASGSAGSTSPANNQPSLLARFFGLSSLENVIFIVLGLMLIWAGLFALSVSGVFSLIDSTHSGVSNVIDKGKKAASTVSSVRSVAEVAAA